MIRSPHDPDGANLDRVQVIKGWFDENGETHERIFITARKKEAREVFREVWFDSEPKRADSFMSA